MRKFLTAAMVAMGFIFISAGNAAEPTIVSPPTSPITPAASPRPAGEAQPSPAAPAASPRPAADVAPTPVTPGGGSGRLVPGFAVSQVPATGAPLVLEAGKGTLIRLTRAAATVFVANPEIADVQVKSPLLIYVSAKAPGETVVYAVDGDDNVLLHSPVRVQHDLSRLRSSIHELMPGEHIAVNSVQNNLVLSGSVSTAGRAEKARVLATALTGDVKGANIVNEMSVATPNQVSLRVKIAEVNRSVLKALGVNWMKTSGGGLLFSTANPTTGGQITNRNIIAGVFGAQSARITATLDALAQEGLITTLAEPNLTALNGQTASFLAGGEFPVPIATNTTNGVPTVTVEFKKFGVSLDFTPTILDATHLNLKIRPEVSQLTTNGAVQINNFTIPALTVRRAETTVELGSGQSFALAGLLQNNSQQDISKIPWIGDIPVIGQLFRSDRFQRNESELVIIVTPYLVQPTSVALATPTDGFNAPHDIQRVLGENYRQGLPAPPRGPLPPGGQGLIGPVGFRLD